MPSRLCIAAISEENNQHKQFFDFASLRSRSNGTVEFENTYKQVDLIIKPCHGIWTCSGRRTR